ncbi:hypothetical protein IPG36_02225 [bacterium]|nr:MAG: hypothetical protein IPG36_02225 [bacterium]
MTEQPMLNHHILMTDPNHIGIAGINAYEDTHHGPDRRNAQQQFEHINLPSKPPVSMSSRFPVHQIVKMASTRLIGP